MIPFPLTLPEAVRKIRQPEIGEPRHVRGRPLPPSTKIIHRSPPPLTGEAVKKFKWKEGKASIVARGRGKFTPPKPGAEIPQSASKRRMRMRWEARFLRDMRSERDRERGGKHFRSCFSRWGSVKEARKASCPYPLGEGVGEGAGRRPGTGKGLSPSLEPGSRAVYGGQAQG